MWRVVWTLHNGKIRQRDYRSYTVARRWYWYYTQRYGYAAIYPVD